MKIPNYKIIKKLGEGGMGTVYLAEHELIKRKVAIKVLHKHLVSNEDFITRFRREAELLATLDHQNIVRLNEYFEHEGSLFLIMEYVDGQELDQYINNVSGPIIEGKLVPMFNQILSAMGYAHKKGLIHRDIKPANILISKDGGTVKILDFGIAKLVTDDIGLTKSGVQVGTVTYMSPEQVNAEEVDKLTDIYSLGVTLYQMAVGQSPYKNTTSFKTQIKIVQDPFPKAQDIYPGVSDKIENIINRATQKAKGDRYQSCEEMKKDLKATKVSPVINNKQKKEIITEKKKNTSYKKIIAIISVIVVVGASLFFALNELNTNKDVVAELDDGGIIEQGITVSDSSEYIYDVEEVPEEEDSSEEVVKDKRSENNKNDYRSTSNTTKKRFKVSHNGNVHFHEKETYYTDENGFFIINYNNGDKYEGNLKDGRKNGNGTYIWANGVVYSGIWKDDVKVSKKEKSSINCDGDCKNGYGTLTYEKGGKYVGNFRSKKRHGHGTYYYTTGSKYVGDWKKGKKHGQGTSFDSHGNEYQVGEWKNDEFVKKKEQKQESSQTVGCTKGDCKNGLGVYIFTSGDKYVGYFKNGLQHGEGIYYYANSNRPPNQGKWKKGEHKKFYTVEDKFRNFE
jgi:serine/threonine protein kinase